MRFIVNGRYGAAKIRDAKCMETSETLYLHDEELFLVAELFVYMGDASEVTDLKRDVSGLPSLSLWKVLRKASSFSLFLRRMVSI